MFGFRKSPAESSTITPARRTSSEPIVTHDDEDDDHFGNGKGSSSSASSKQQKKDFDSMSVQELEGYAVNQAEETTKSVNNCLKIAEDIKQDATRTLDTLHQQGEQIHRTHVMAADMERDLTKGEKLLNNLGGMFSMPWKPKKGKKITGPMTTQDDNYTAKRSSREQREKLGLVAGAKGRGGSRTPPPEPTNALQKVEFEKSKQDDSLSDLSGILGDLKGMALDMGSELDRQNKALDHLDQDVDELNNRVKGANQRARKLIGK